MSFLKYLVTILSLVGIAVHADLGPDDPVVVGQTFLAGSEDPTSGSTPWSLASHGIAEKLFTVNENGEIVGQIAESVSKVSEFVWEVTLKEGYKFSDGDTVDASHVADCMMELNQLNSNAQGDLGTITVRGSGTSVFIESTVVTHVMDAVLAGWVFVIYKKDDAGNFIYTGPYKVESFTDAQIDLVPNMYYVDNKSLERPEIMLKKFADGHALAEGLKNNEVDIAFHLPIDTLQDIRAIEGKRVKSFEVGYHYMMFHNMDSLDNRFVRKAIDMAVDRTILTQALAGGTPTHSLFPDFTPYYADNTPDPHGNAEGAKHLLESAGYTMNSAGKYEMDGEVLHVNLVAYPHRPGLVLMQPVIAQALEDIGIEVTQTLTGFDWSETATIMSERTFDLLMWAQHTLPAGDPYWFLNTFFSSGGGNNHAGLKSDAVDNMLATLALAEDHDDRVALTNAAHTLILNEVPVSNLMTPYWHVGLSARMSEYQPWGADYYVIRNDLFVGDGTSVGDEPEDTPEPTDAPVTTPDWGGLCFSGENLVETQEEGFVTMDSLKIGDSVRVQDGNFAKIYSFGHYDTDKASQYLQIHSSGNKAPLELSEKHMVFVNDGTTVKSVPADTIKVGDNLVSENGTPSKVSKIKSVTRKGAYAPFTASGDIVVSGIVASNYISMISEEHLFPGVSMQFIAHSFNAPHRMVCAIHFNFFCKDETYTAEGLSNWIYYPYHVANWLGQQSDEMKMVGSTFLLASMLLSPIIVGVMGLGFLLGNKTNKCKTM